MDALKSFIKWRDDRYRIIQLRHEIEHLDNLYYAKLKDKKYRRGSDEAEHLYWNYRNDIDLAEASLDELETAAALKRARKWGVPVPHRPNSEEDENDTWNWSSVHFRHYLSTEGKARLRRQCYAEVEMFYKPWATWLAVGISVLSLAISIFKS
ncbi:hypothetical protein FY134_04500 [Agrobacterium fabrum]|uniref:hypothetical protein n=1 Tax=Agrobacterium fabrum TaxID=1176649 RepID=UPI0021CF588A|nr:hypothetical protein [Agrobacterium fabrum]UXT56948.1 hypothetical protein FY134_04500 [Agrobacterium fabrum]